jgi:hypothetical protein
MSQVTVARPDETADPAPRLELSRAQMNVVFVTILLGLLLSALDQTIVSTAADDRRRPGRGRRRERRGRRRRLSGGEARARRCRGLAALRPRWLARARNLRPSRLVLLILPAASPAPGPRQPRRCHIVLVLTTTM